MEVPPEIVLYDMLPRLPTQSLRRFMCVCKLWLSFLTTPVFYKLHVHHVTNDHQNHTKFLESLYPTTRRSRTYKFRTIDCETPKDGFTAVGSFPFIVGPHQHIHVEASLHGLMYIRIYEDYSLDTICDLILWNPLTGDYKTLSKPSSFHEECYKFGRGSGLYYSSCDDDYKILLVTDRPSAYIYSLKSDSWRKLLSVDPRCCNALQWTSVWLDEKLYFLPQFAESYYIIRFDTKTEKLEKVADPPFVNDQTTTSGIDFMVRRGCIHFCVRKGEYRHPTTFELWRMDEDRDWTKVVTLYINDRPLHLMRNGNLLMWSFVDDHVYELDTNKDTKDRVCSYRVCSYVSYPETTYMETIVSPNRYIK